MQQIILYGSKAVGRVALIDDEDYASIAQHRWHVHERTYPGAHSVIKNGPYAFTLIPTGGEPRQKWVSMHGMITGWPMVDHVNHDGLDNRRDNLRPADKSLNAANQRLRTDGTSRYKGVYLTRSGSWKSRIQVNGKRKYLGSFSTEDAAAQAYNRAATEIFGPYAYLNPVPEI